MTPSKDLVIINNRETLPDLKFLFLWPFPCTSKSCQQLLRRTAQYNTPLLNPRGASHTTNRKEDLVFL